MSEKKSIEVPYGKARQLLRETGLATENNQFVFTFAQWAAIDNAVEQLEEERAALKQEGRGLRSIVVDLVAIMKEPAIRGAKTAIQMCKFLDVWILDLEDALPTAEEQE